jgi:hypothetical protein
VSTTSTVDRQVVLAEHDARPSRGAWRASDALALFAVGIAGVLVLVPTLAHGTFFGPYDILQSTGLNKVPKVQVHNATLFDQISLFIPWTHLDWTQVHQGHLPLWNPYSALGMPLGFNWESAPLSLPALIGYLFPVRLAYTAQVVVTMMVAGSGVYVLGKVLRLGVLGCMTAAIAFELSGAFTANLGWPLDSVWSLGGWLFAAILLVLRGTKRAQVIVLLAVVIAFAIYAGNPEDEMLLALSAAIFTLAMLLFRAPALGGSGPVVRPALDLGISAIAGAALAAPLILPGLQLARGSNRTAVGPDLFPKGLPPKELFHLIFQGFDGLPVLHSQWFGISAYVVSSAYLGVIVLVLAATALVLRWRRPEVRSLAALAVATGILVFTPPLVSLLDSSIVRIYWIFALTPMVLALAVLSGVGMDVLVESHGERRVRRVLAIGFAGMAVVIGIIWLVARRGLTPSQASIRAHSFIWPAIEVVTGLVVVWVLARVATRSWTRLSPSAAGTLAGSVLLLVLTAFLVASGAPIYSSSSDYPTSTPAVASLQRVIGNWPSASEVRLRTPQIWASWSTPTSSTTSRSSAPTTRCYPTRTSRCTRRLFPNWRPSETSSVRPSPPPRLLDSTGSAICSNRLERPDPRALSSFAGWTMRTCTGCRARQPPRSWPCDPMGRCPASTLPDRPSTWPIRAPARGR